MSIWHHLYGLITIAILALSISVSPAAAQYGAQTDGEWPTYGGDLGNTKYSPLDQITKDNFGKLEIVWRAVRRCFPE